MFRRYFLLILAQYERLNNAVLFFEIRLNDIDIFGKAVVTKLPQIITGALPVC